MSTVAIRALHPMPVHLHAAGHDILALLRDADIDSTRIYDATYCLDDAKHFDLWCRTVQLTGNRDFGVTLAEELDLRMVHLARGYIVAQRSHVSKSSVRFAESQGHVTSPHGRARWAPRRRACICRKPRKSRAATQVRILRTARALLSLCEVCAPTE